MKLRFSGFDWDHGNSQKCEKHGVSKKEIENLFLSGRLLIGSDSKHSDRESRMFAIGKPTKTKRQIFVIFTLREINEETLIRPISARFMHKQEIKLYEKTLAETEK